MGNFLLKQKAASKGIGAVLVVQSKKCQTLAKGVRGRELSNRE